MTRTTAQSLFGIALGTMLIASCQFSREPASPLPDKARNTAEPAAPDSFLANCRRLRASGGFRQNIWLCARQDSRAGICMDRERQLYLVIPHDPKPPVRTESPAAFRHLRIAPDALRRKLDPDAFILGSRGKATKPATIYQIPDNADESFALALINHHCQLDLKPAELSLQWD